MVVLIFLSHCLRYFVCSIFVWYSSINITFALLVVVPDRIFQGIYPKDSSYLDANNLTPHYAQVHIFSLLGVYTFARIIRVRNSSSSSFRRGTQQCSCSPLDSEVSPLSFKVPFPYFLTMKSLTWIVPVYCWVLQVRCTYLVYTDAR